MIVLYKFVRHLTLTSYWIQVSMISGLFQRPCTLAMKSVDHLGQIPLAS
jgi:hypothetical protein